MYLTYAKRTLPILDCSIVVYEFHFLDHLCCSSVWRVRTGSARLWAPYIALVYLLHCPLLVMFPIRKHYLFIRHFSFISITLSFFVKILFSSWGRRTALILTAVSAGVAGVIRSFSTGYVMYIVLEFVEATVGSGVYSTGFILGINTFLFVC